MERAARQMSAAIFLKDNVVGENSNSTVDFKTISFEKDSCEKTRFQFCWYRKSLLLANNKGTDQTAIMSKPAYLSVEIVTDKPTSAKFLYHRVVSVAEQTGLSLTWSQTQYLLCQLACVSTLHAECPDISRCLLSADFYINFFYVSDRVYTNVIISSILKPS